MATNRFSLSDYIVTITVDSDSTAIPQSYRGLSLQIGGPGSTPDAEGSFLGDIAVTRAVDAWTTEGDATGSWIHNKSNDKTGTVQLNIRQVSDDIIKLSQLCAVYERIQSNAPGLRIQITKAATESSSDIIVRANDCYIQKQADLQLQATAQLQQWTFTCGQIFFY